MQCRSTILPGFGVVADSIIQGVEHTTGFVEIAHEHIVAVFQPEPSYLCIGKFRLRKNAPIAGWLREFGQWPAGEHVLVVAPDVGGTGLRVGECVGSTKADILLDQKAISVNHTLIYRQLDGKCQFRVTTPKTQKGNRLVPMLPDVERYLRSHLEIMDELYSKPCPTIQGYTDFIFRNRLGELMNPHCLNRAIDRISRDYNAQETELATKENREPLLLPHFSVHNLRHTFCTRLFEVEPDFKFIQQVMGHAEIFTTMDIYTHITQEKMSSTVQSISKNLSLF